MAEVASAYVSLLPSAKGFGSATSRQVDPQLARAGKQGGGRFAAGLKSAIGPAVALLGVGAVSGLLKGSIEEAREAQKVGALTNAVIKSTGGVANVSAAQVDRLSTSLSNKIGVDDEAIAAGQNMLLTFSGVRDEVGKGNKIFTRATVIVQDMAATFGGDAVSNSKMLGKALNDPTKGVSALTRVGVSFTAQQKEQIKTLQASGNVLGAQKIILAEVAKQTKGSAEATATSGDKAAVALGNLKEQIGVALLPVVDRLAAALSAKVIPAVSRFISQMQDGTGAGGRVASALQDVWTSAQAVGKFVTSAVQAFRGLPDATQKVLLLAAAALVLQSRFAGPISSLQNFDRTAALATAKTVAMRGGALAAGAALAGLASSAGGSSTALGSLATVGASIATGFAVAGPWGAAIGGATGVLALFAGRSRAASAAQNELDASGKRVAATLNTQTGAITANTRAVAAKELADRGAFSAAKAMGISLEDVLNASLGNEGALKRVTAASESWADSQAKAGNYTEKQEGQLKKLRDAIGITNSSLAAQREKINDVNSALGGATAATRKADKAIRDMANNASNSAGKMAAAGAQAGAGFANGLRGWLGEIAAIGAQIGATVAKAARDKLKVKSPSRVMYDIGSFAGDGLALGVASSEPRVRKAASGAGAAIANGVRAGLRDGTGGLDAYLKNVTKKITDSLELKKTRPGMSKRARRRVQDFNDDARKSIKAQKAAVDQLAKSLSGLGRKIDDARSNLQGLKDARASLADQTASSISGELDLTQTGGKKLSFATVAANVSGLATRAKAFAGKLRSLLAAGIPAGLVQEVASLGTVQGSSVADALLSGSQQQVGQLAADYAGIDAYSRQIGEVVAGSMYDAGIAAQQGILKGLLDDRAIQGAADKLASKLTKAVKKSLGIKSPSKVFQNEVGQHLPAGIVAGIDDGQRALDRRVAGMVSTARIGKIQPGDLGGGMAASGDRPEVNQYIYPQPGQSDQEIGNAAANRLMFAMT